MIEIDMEIGEVEATIEINDSYVELWETAIEHDGYDGPEEFEDWAANLVAQNANQFENTIEQAANRLYQQTKNGA